MVTYNFKELFVSLKQKSLLAYLAYQKKMIESCYFAVAQVRVLSKTLYSHVELSDCK